MIGQADISMTATWYVQLYNDDVNNVKLVHLGDVSSAPVPSPLTHTFDPRDFAELPDWPNVRSMVIDAKFIAHGFAKGMPRQVEQDIHVEGGILPLNS